MAAEPTIRVDIAWTGNFNEADPTWTDITEYVNSISTSMGRTDEISDIETGTTNLELDNSDGAFTPENPDSPFYPNVLPQRQVRGVSIAEDGTEYPLFRGHVEEWPVDFDGTLSTVTITVSDTLDYLSSASLEPTVDYAQTAMSTPPWAAWYGFDSTTPRLQAKYPSRVGDTTRNAMTGSTSWNVPGKFAVVDSMMVTMPDYKCLHIGGGTNVTVAGKTYGRGGFLRCPCPNFNLNSGECMVFAAVNMETAAAGDGVFAPIVIGWQNVEKPSSPQNYSAYLILQYDKNADAWSASYQQFDFDANQWDTLFSKSIVVGAGSAATLNQNIVAMLGWDADTKTLAYGAQYDAGIILEDTVSFSGFRVPQGKPQAFVLGAGLGAGYGTGLTNGRIQYVAVWDTYVPQFPDDNSFGMYDFTSLLESPWAAASLPGPIIAMYLDMLGWPAELADLDYGWQGYADALGLDEDASQAWTRANVNRAFYLCPTPTSSSDTALDRINVATDSDGGLFYIDAGGRAVFESRYQRAIKNGYDWTLDGTAGTGVEQGVSFRMSRDDIDNSLTINNDYYDSSDTEIQTALTFSDPDSIALYGAQERELDACITDVYGGQDYQTQRGRREINRHAKPFVRVLSVSVNASAQADGALWDFVTRATLSDRVLLKGLPSTAPASEMPVFIESIQHSITRDGEALEWTTTCDVSPAGTPFVGWLLGDTTRSVLGTSTSLIS